MSKSENIGQLSKLDLNEINEKLRTVQRLLDGVFSNFGKEYLTNYLNNSRHDLTTRHTLGDVVPHDSILNLVDVNVVRFKDNENKVLKITNDGVEVGVDTITAIVRAGNGIAVTDENSNNISNISLSNLTVETHTADYVLTSSDFFRVHIFDCSSQDLVCSLPSVDSTDLGLWVVIVRIGDYVLEIDAADADLIIDGIGITCTDFLYSYCSFSPILLTSTQWGVGPINFGRWGTI